MRMYQGFKSLIFRVNKQEKDTLKFIFGATLLVMGIIVALVPLGWVGLEWVLLPASWWVGAMMTFLFDKYWKSGRAA